MNLNKLIGAFAPESGFLGFEVCTPAEHLLPTY